MDPLQNDDGGFAWSPGEGSSIGATATALRVLRLGGGRLRDIASCLRFVASCHDRAGGFASGPGGEIGIPTTAYGLIASAELDELPIFWREAGVAYFLRNARTFRDAAMGITVLARMRMVSSAPRSWKELALAGTWGDPVETAEHVVALALVGVAIPEHDAVVAALVAARATSLGDAYWIVHALHLLGAVPNDPSALRGLAAGATTLEETFFALSIARWLDDGP